MLKNKKDALFFVLCVIYVFGCVGALKNVVSVCYVLFAIWFLAFRETLDFKGLLSDKLLRGTIVLFSVFLGTFFIANIVTSSPMGTERSLVYLKSVFAGVFFYIVTYKRENVLPAVLCGATLGVLALCIPALKVATVLKRAEYVRLGEHNAFGGWCALVLPFYLGLSYVVVKSKTTKVIATIISILLVFSLIASTSRGAQLATLVMFFVGGLVTKNKQLRKWCSISLLVFCAILGLVYFFGLLQLKHNDMARIYLWQGGIAMFKDYPWFGVGSGNWHSLYLNNYFPVGAWEKHITTPHNIILDSLDNVGLFGTAGLITFIVYHLKFLVTSVYEANEERCHVLLTVLLLCFVGLLVHGMVDIIAYNRYCIIIYSLFWAIVCYTISTFDNV